MDNQIIDSVAKYGLFIHITVNIKYENILTSYGRILFPSNFTLPINKTYNIYYILYIFIIVF